VGRILPPAARPLGATNLHDLTEESEHADAFEDALAECIEEHAESGWEAAMAVLSRYPEWEARLRERLGSLERSGLMSTSQDDGLPRRFGNYQLLNRLGQGGAGTVYLARDERQGREVALKMSSMPIQKGDRAAERFAREARALTELLHPCIVPVIDVGEVEGLAYFTMEYVRGCPLDEAVSQLQAMDRDVHDLEGGDLDTVVGHTEGVWMGHSYVESICRIILDVADALEHAHTSGVLHRDVKPSNVLLRRDGRAQLFDFGLAQLSDQPALTRTGEFTGTPYYIAPEQLSGHRRDLDARVDVYALGVTLYEMLTLQRPYEGKTTPALFRDILTRDAVPPGRVNPAVPHDLETICLAAMEKDPQRRYSSAGALAADLRRFLAYQPIQARKIGMGRRLSRAVRRRPVLATVVGAVLVALLALPVVLMSINRAISEERDEAQHQLVLRNEVVEFLVGLFELSGDSGEAAREGARELLRAARNDLEIMGASQPQTRAALLAASAQAHQELGLLEEAGALLDRAFAIQQSVLGQEHSETVATLGRLAAVRLALGQHEMALGISGRVVRTYEALHEEGSPAGMRARLVLARAAIAVGQTEQARESVGILMDLLGPQSTQPLAAEVHEVSGGIELLEGNPEQGRFALERALTIHRERWQPDLVRMARVHELLEQWALRAGSLELAADHRAARERLLNDSAASEPPYPLEEAPRKSAAYRAAFQAGITAHVAGDVEGARASFEECIEILPGDPVAPYNIACTLALHASPLEAAGWIERARRAGYGSSQRRIEVMNMDPELAALRTLPEGRAALEAVLDQGRAFQAERERVFRLEPEPRSDKPGLLVLLAGEGVTRESMGAGPWPALASKEGLILLAPPAPFGLGALPQAGQSWIDDERTILADPRPRSRELLVHLRAALADTTLERGRVVLVGEGLGATIALDLALLAPGLFKKVLLVNGAPHRTSSDGRAAGAAALGVEVRLVWNAQGPLPLVTAVSNETVASEVEIWLQEACGLSARVDTPGEGVEFRHEVLSLLLRD